MRLSLCFCWLDRLCIDPEKSEKGLKSITYSSKNAHCSIFIQQFNIISKIRNRLCKGDRDSVNWPESLSRRSFSRAFTFSAVLASYRIPFPLRVVGVFLPAVMVGGDGLKDEKQNN